MSKPQFNAVIGVTNTLKIWVCVFLAAISLILIMYKNDGELIQIIIQGGYAAWCMRLFIKSLWMSQRLRHLQRSPRRNNAPTIVGQPYLQQMKSPPKEMAWLLPFLVGAREAIPLFSNLEHISVFHLMILQNHNKNNNIYLAAVTIEGMRAQSAFEIRAWLQSRQLPLLCGTHRAPTGQLSTKWVSDFTFMNPLK